MGGYFSTPERPTPLPSLLEEPWRPTTIRWESSQYRDELKEFALQAKPIHEMEQQWYNILLFAPVGAGKTSFLNTIQSAFKGRISKEGVTGIADKTLTLSYRIYPIRDGERRPLGFRLCDTPGTQEDFNYSDDAFKTLIDGTVTEGFKYWAPVEGADNTGNTESKITCVCFVFNASTFEVLPQERLTAFRRYQTLLNQYGVGRRIIILTHIDKVCPEARYEDVKKVFLSRKILNVVQKASVKFGIPVNEIFPIKNYDCEAENVLAIDILTLYNLKMILNMCEDSLTHKLN